jgi:hypothetical protein
LFARCSIVTWWVDNCDFLHLFKIRIFRGIFCSEKQGRWVLFTRLTFDSQRSSCPFCNTAHLSGGAESSPWYKTVLGIDHPRASKHCFEELLDWYIPVFKIL